MDPVQTSVWLTVFTMLIVQVCPVTVASSVALAVALAGSSNVALAVPTFVTEPVTTAPLVNVALAPGARGPKLPMLP